jgi:hypothetical protein
VAPRSLELGQVDQTLRAFLVHDSAFELMIKHTLLMFEYVVDDALGSKEV